MKNKTTSIPSNQLTLDYSPRNKTSFLQELAGYIRNHSHAMGDMTIVFPNRRAGLYFLRVLAEEVKVPTWGPDIFTLEDYYGKYTDLTLADRYSLIFRLYRVYSTVYESSETLDSFFFWGEMLLKDFDEIDRFLVDPDPLFSTLKEYKSIETLDYLDEDQKEIIRKFWQTVEKSKSPESWVAFWSKLIQVYKLFRESLREDGIGYPGMLLRDSLESVKRQSISNKVIFAGFNALTTAEEEFITHFIKNCDAEILWDVDEFYMKSPHEAGKYLRKYQQNDTLNQWLGNISSDHLTSQKNIKVIGSGTWIGQVKVVGQILEEISQLSGFEEESTVIVLPDEKLLLPVLNAVPPSISDINVTMGIMLRYTSAYSLLENLIILQKNSRVESGVRKYYHRNISTILRHPVTQSIHKTRSIRFERHVRKTAQLYYSKQELAALEIEINPMYEDFDGHLTSHLADVALYLFEHTSDRLQKIFLNALYHHLLRLADTITEYEIDLDFDSLIRLFRQIAQTGRIPFSGEPVKGLQIMGLFETRNIDFDNVFILSLNEGILPRGLHSQSFIPYALRRGFEMPTFEDSHSIQSYLFYRCLQRSRRVHLLYNSIGEIIGGETSRYIQQLKYGFPVEVEFVQLKESYQADHEKVISVGQAPHITESLQRYTTGESYLSPTAIASYLDCSLKFYFKYILRLRQENDIDEDISPLQYGNLLHNSAENFYDKYKGTVIDEFGDKSTEIRQAIAKAFEETVFDPQHGPARIREEALAKTMQRVIEVDEALTPLEIVDLEAEYKAEIELNEVDLKVTLGGKIDRVDRLRDGTTRLIDYKTGSDSPTYKDLDSVFNGENKAVFQLMMYSLLYMKSDVYKGEWIRPGLYAMRSVFKEDFSPTLVEGKYPNKAWINEVNGRMIEFEERLKTILSDIFVQQKFEQTEVVSKCEFCEFAAICRREKHAKTNG